MSYDISSKQFERDGKIETLARKCRLGDEDEARSLSLYHGMIDAIADRVASRDREPSPPPPVVYIAAYQHRFGVDLSAHRSRDNAESQLLSIAWKQCMRDPAIRAAVDARFGPLVSQEPPLEHPFEADLGSAWSETEPASDGYGLSSSEPYELVEMIPGESRDVREDGSGADHHEERRRTFCEQLLEEWPDFAKGELLWIAECVVEDDEVSASRRGGRDDEAMEADAHGSDG